jgi:hypothetical protein
MTITADELAGTSTSAEVDRPPSPTNTTSSVRIVEWVDEVPQHRRVSPFDGVIEELRRLGDSEKIAKIEWDEKPISANKVNQLRKRYPDCEFKQVSTSGGRETFVSYKGNAVTS